MMAGVRQRAAEGDDDAASAPEAERALVERAVAGDQDAFHRLYEAHIGAVFAFLRARAPHELAEDLSAETFCRAYQHIGRYEWRGAPYRAWLLRIARNLLIAHWRSKASAVQLYDDLEPVTGAHVDVDPSDRMVADEVVAMLTELPDRHREVIELRFLEERSVAETAVVLDISEEAVRALTFRAMRTLRALCAKPGTVFEP
jgi:RNA polymerase sigma-70 factor (ECF subfamily)